MKTKPPLLTLLVTAGVAGAFLYRHRDTLKKLFGLVSALQPEGPTNTNMDPSAFAAALSKLQGAVAYLENLPTLLTRAHTELTRLRAEAGGAADDKARIDQLTADLATANGQLGQFAGLADAIGTGAAHADAADDAINRDLDGEGPPPGGGVPTDGGGTPPGGEGGTDPNAGGGGGTPTPGDGTGTGEGNPGDTGGAPSGDGTGASGEGNAGTGTDTSGAGGGADAGGAGAPSGGDPPTLPGTGPANP